jgi:gluconolactonase
MYVADTDGARIVRFGLDTRLGPPEVVATLERGRPDGFTFDVEGNVIVGAVMLDGDRRGEIQTWSLDGDLVDVVAIPRGRLCTNVFLADDGRLVATVGDTGELLVYAGWPARGLPPHPFRSARQTR